MEVRFRTWPPMVWVPAELQTWSARTLAGDWQTARQDARRLLHAFVSDLTLEGWQAEAVLLGQAERVPFTVTHQP